MHNKEIMKEVLHSLFHQNILIVWQPEYDLGVPIVDEQHRGIVSTINSLFYAIQTKQGEEKLQPIVGMVNEYTRIHFDIEEAFLEKCGFPDLEAHIELHNHLREKLTDVGMRSVWDKNPNEFLTFLKNWWINHICDKDRHFRDFLLKESPHLLKHHTVIE